MTPEEILMKGKEMLDSYMNANGFEFVFAGTGQGSGGVYAHGQYVRDDRFLDLHYRYGLGIVTYHIGEHELPHKIYMKMAGADGKNHYPGFSDDRLQAFRDLLFDIDTFASDFISGDGKDFVNWATEFKNK